MCVCVFKFNSKTNISPLFEKYDNKNKGIN